ncbi:MAG: serine/threonine protein kinase [Planctomycetota bacterium]|jgi:serine/threonine-protein kinase
MEKTGPNPGPTPTPQPSEEGKGHRLFGEIAVAKGFATPEQIQEALAVQADLRRLDMAEKIGQILIKRKFLDRAQVKTVLKEQGAKSIRDIIEGFEIHNKIGQGGMGAVFRAVQKSTGREVALKILPPQFNRDTTYLKRFLREAKVAAQLNHPNIVQCIDAGFSRGHNYIAMEYVRGTDLDSILRQEGRFLEAEALQIAEQVSRALEHAHRKQLVHRDIKPSNIMITKDGLAKLLDLGLAKGIGPENATDTNRITQTGMAVGTPCYIAPEQAQGAQDMDIRADIYSLGATLFHMVTGKTPFSAPSPAGILVMHISSPVPKANQIEPTVSEATSHLIEIMMAKSPEKRFADPQKLVQAILETREGIPPTGPPVDGAFLDAPTITTGAATNTLEKLSSSVRSGLGKSVDAVGGEVKGWFRSRFFLAAAGAGIVMIAASVILLLVGLRGEGEPLFRPDSDSTGKAENSDDPEAKENTPPPRDNGEGVKGSDDPTPPPDEVPGKKPPSSVTNENIAEQFQEERQRTQDLRNALEGSLARGEEIPREFLIWAIEQLVEREKRIEAMLESLDERDEGK